MSDKKIYIIGPVGSGKTTLSKKLSQKLKIKYYELDKIVWDDDNGNIKRSQKEIDRLFNQILATDSWIIEDVGRAYFKKAIKESDIIYYIKLNKILLYTRIIKRWIKQKLNLENYNYRPTIKSLLEMFKWAKDDLKNQHLKVKELSESAKNLIILNSRTLNKLSK